MSAVPPEALWYAGRGTGVASLALLTLVVVLGIATSSGRRLPGLPRFAVATLHRNVSLLAVGLLGVHVGTLFLDPYAGLRAVDLVVPFAGVYRPVFLGLGTVGLDIVAALVLTSLVRRRLGLRAWRAVHWLAYAAWPVALLHGLGTGSDAGTGWLRGIAAACLAAVVGATVWRVSASFGEYAQQRGRTGPPDPAAHVPAEVAR